MSRPIMQFDKWKLKTVILYACSKCEPSKLGAVKLHKVLYFADMANFAHIGSPITGSTYRKRQLGPTCDQLLPTLRELEKENVLEIRNVEYHGYLKKEYISRVEPRIDALSKAEIDLLDEVIDFVCKNNSARTISEFSHNRAWELAEFGEELPYHTAFHLFPYQVSLEALESSTDEVERIATERSKYPALADVHYSDFRSRVLQGGGSLR